MNKYLEKISGIKEDWKRNKPKKSLLRDRHANTNHMSPEHIQAYDEAVLLDKRQTLRKALKTPGADKVAITSKVKNLLKGPLGKLPR